MWALLQALWTRDYAARLPARAAPRQLTRSRLAPRLCPQAVAAALASAAWRPATAPVVAAVAAGHRARTLALLSSAYTTISLAAVAAFLALPEPDALAGTPAAPRWHAQVRWC